IVLLVLVALFAPSIATHYIGTNDLANRLQSPSWAHYFGTDELGRDIFSRLVFGSRITLYIVTLTAIIAAPIGLIVGTTAGYIGGWVD
ncbi:D,D-dipeptide ABC transporter permease, partial [Serratia marcescens]|nr:D,D-dipeptide ABC transporter permease [Serratia marcescens]